MRKESCAIVVLLGLTAVLAGCGGDSTTTPTAVATPTPTPAPVRQVIFQGDLPDIPVFGPGPIGPLKVLSFSTTALGTLDAIVDWTFASNDIGLALIALDNCPGFTDLGSTTCPYVTISDTTNKPETLVHANAAAGGYGLVIVNNGSTKESGSGEIGLTTTGAASALTKAVGIQIRPATGIRPQDER